MTDGMLNQSFGKKIAQGEIIFRQGDKAENMYIIQQGKIRISRMIQGKEHILAVLERGEFFGEMAIVNLTNRTATATAITDCELLQFDRTGFLSMINKNGKIALNIIDKLCRRLYKANLQIQHLVPNNKTGLTALNLFYAFKGSGRADGTISWENTIEEISLDLALSQEDVKSILNGLMRQGIIKLENDNLILLDKDKLQNFTEKILSTD
jgi:CRP/FNR family cyclic AMP-dependent transcriptional regulator